MTKVLSALRSAKRLANKPTGRVVEKSASRSRATAVGTDGLTESERLELLVRYRANVGRKPALTEEHRLRSEAIREKLAPRPRPRAAR